MVSYSKPNFKSDSAFGRAHWKPLARGGSVAGSGKGGKGKGGKGKGGERRFNTLTSDQRLYPLLPLWHFTLSTTEDSPLAQLISHSFSDNTQLFIQCPLSKIHSDKDGFRVRVSVSASTSLPALELKNSKLRPQWEAQRLQFYNQLGLPCSPTALYSDIWRIITPSSRSQPIEALELFKLWEENGHRLMRQAVRYDKDAIIPMHDHDDIAHLEEALLEGYEGFHHNPLFCATGDAVSPGAAPSFNLFVLFETVEMARDATQLALRLGRPKGWLANMTKLDAVPQTETFANTKAALSRMTLAELNARLEDKKSNLLGIYAALMLLSKLN